ncbi:hypothetical protein V1478_003466 [Vespula squamosa]|uniref:Uncharacterized protein n=1 Tax=Vespula squamosa TaxID=30214 RepID=A0ABD2BLW7_VESSQ
MKLNRYISPSKSNRTKASVLRTEDVRDSSAKRKVGELRRSYETTLFREGAPSFPRQDRKQKKDKYMTFRDSICYFKY